MITISQTSARRNLAEAYHHMLNEDFEQFMWDHADDVIDMITGEGCKLSTEVIVITRMPRELRMTMLMGGPL